MVVIIFILQFTMTPLKNIATPQML